MLGNCVAWFDGNNNNSAALGVKLGFNIDESYVKLQSRSALAG